MTPGIIQIVYLPRKLYEINWDTFVVDEKVFSMPAPYTENFFCVFLQERTWKAFNQPSKPNLGEAIKSIENTIPIYPHFGYGFFMTPIGRDKVVMTPHELFRVV